MKTAIDLSRRRHLCQLAAFWLAGSAYALPSVAPGREENPRENPLPRLNARQNQALRAWIVRIAEEQVKRGPSPRWAQHDCAGLVRFAVAEALADHDARWRRNMNIGARLPPDLVPAEWRAQWRHRWRRPDGSSGAYVNAIGIIQENSFLVGRDVRLSRPADLLFFDQGDAQHLMLWTGYHIVYHNGAAPKPDDNGLRAVSLRALLDWNDTRWRPEAENRNFTGVFSLTFLA